MALSLFRSCSWLIRMPETSDRSGLRLRSVRFKDGRTFTVLRPEQNYDRRIVESGVREVLDQHSVDFAGYAFMVWGMDGSSTCDLQTKSNIPSILVPDFVRNRLLGMKIEEWILKDLQDK